VEVGSRDSVAARGYYGAQAGPGLFTINAQGARSSGFVPLTEARRGPVDEPSPYREANLRARWVAPLAGDVELQASGLGFVDVRDRGVPFTGNRTRGADASLRLVGSGRWQWAATGYAQWRNFRSSFASVDDDRTEAVRVALQDSVPSRGFGGSVEVRPPLGGGAELRIGADARFTSGESRELYAFSDGEPTRRRIAGGDSGTQGLFAEASWTRAPLTLSGGARLDRWSIFDGSLVERLIATGVATRDERYPVRSGWRPTARAAALLEVGSGISLRSAAYLGWRMPTLNELFRPFRVGPDATAANPLLDPERLAGAEAGVRYRRGTIDLSGSRQQPPRLSMPGSSDGPSRISGRPKPRHRPDRCRTSLFHAGSQFDDVACDQPLPTSMVRP
jgi:vitamin B12 transporter